ncbi:MAG: helix-turn-helix domain-containing protein [Verrucomicrobiaceae bacterium]|nr:helix-turn-helix domain-containing protein [Verrucomicrobiaceae bacterium]
MSWYYHKPYVSAAQRRAEARRQLEKLKKAGRTIEPLGELSHRIKIATSFWGRAWCDHLETFSDYDNRLPRGRTYVRNGSVLHLSIEKGKITALVQGSELYEQVIQIKPLAAAKWKRIKQRCQGGVGSLIELLQGDVSDEIMAAVTDPADGLFPTLREIGTSCSCPDWADLCKHLAAIFYGVGAKLDRQPELLFTLRGVDHRELIDEVAVTTAIAATARPGRRRTLNTSALGDVFGIELEGPPEDSPAEPAAGTAPKRKKSGKKSSPGHPSETPSAFEATAASVKKLRTEIGLSRAEFAEWVGVSAQSVANWEKQRGPLNLRRSSLENLATLHQSLDLD